MHKMETGAARPSISLARRLEKILKLKIIELYTDVPDLAETESGKEMTLGDFMKVSPIRELRLHFEYSDSKNNKFCSEKELIPEKVNSGAFYRIGAEAGDFFPAKPLIRFTINSVEPLPRTGYVDLRYATFFYKGKEGHLEIGISGTVGAIWQFSQDEINGAFQELVDRKVTRMIQNGEYEGELIIINDSLPADKAGFESYQKFRDEIK